jgi:ribosomal subunit interface protein
VEIVVSGRHTEVPERFRRLAEEKLLKIGQLAPKAHRTDVELSHERNPRQSQNCEKVEITVRGKGPVIRAEASAEDPAAALDLAFGKLLERLRRSRDRRKVHHGRQTPRSVRLAAAADSSVDASVDASADGRESAGAGAGGGVDAAVDADHGADQHGADQDRADQDRADQEHAPDGVSPVVIRAKDHDAVPMTLDQALYEMELVGHDFYLFVDAESRQPSVVYRRRGWSYGVIRLRMSNPSTQATNSATSSDSTGSLDSVDVSDVAAGSAVSGRD